MDLLLDKALTASWNKASPHFEVEGLPHTRAQLLCMTPGSTNPSVITMHCLGVEAGWIVVHHLEVRTASSEDSAHLRLRHLILVASCT